MSIRVLYACVCAFVLTASFPNRADADTNFRTRMLVVAPIDGYSTDDDITAIGRFLHVAGDRNITLPADIETWIISRVNTGGPQAIPRLIGPFMHFLRGGTSAVPFACGAQGSPRNLLLRAIAGWLQNDGTPLANLALLMFQESDDPFLTQLANSTNYSPLKSFPWIIGNDDWMPWIWDGLTPNNQSAPGLLPHVRSFLSGVAFRPPVTASSMNFLGFTQHGVWGQFNTTNPVPAPTLQDATNQAASLYSTISSRVSAMLGVSQQDATVNQQFQQANNVAFEFSGAPLPLSMTSKAAAESYLFALPLVQPPAGQSNDLTRLATVIGEQQGRLLALAAYGLLAYQQSHHGAASDIGMQEVFSQLTAITLPAAESKSVIVPELSPADLASAAGFDLSSLAQCNPTAFQVVSRKLSLADHEYLETIMAQCSGGTSTQIIKSGAIPTDLVRMLEINPGFLDIVAQSLAARDISGLLGEQIENPDDLFLVESESWTALATCLADLANPTAQWRYSRDVLLQNYPRALDWFTPGWRPSGPEVTQLGYASAVVALLAADDFTAQKTSFFAGEINLLQWTADVRFLQDIAPALDAMSSNNHCTSECVQGYGCQTGCGGSHPTAKQAIENQFNTIVAAATASGQWRSSLSDPACVAPQTHKSDQIKIIVNQDTLDFATQYLTDACVGAAQGSISSLSLPTQVQQALTEALEEDPTFLNRYQLDLVPSSSNVSDAQSRLGSILGSAAFEWSGSANLISYLYSTGLAFYLPDIPAPLGAWDLSYLDPTSNNLGSSSPVTVTLSPLLTTSSALDLANDLAAIQYVSSQLPTATTADLTQISDSFIGTLRSAENSSIATINQAVDKQAAPIVSAMNQQQSSNWSVGLTLGIGQGVVPGLYFDYQGVGLNVTLNLPSTISIGPVLPAFSIPEIPLVFPGSGAGGLPLPGLTIPLTSQNVPMSVAQIPPTAPDDGSPDPSTVLAGVDWGSLLSENNYVGRVWLQSEIAIAKPLLTPQQLQQISQGLQQPTFPTDLAKLIAQEAAQASGNPSTGVSPLLNPNLQNACNGTSWSSCGVGVQRALNSTSDPNDVVNLAVLWGHAFDIEYDALRTANNLQSATPEAEQMEQIIEGNLSPVEIAKDQAEEALVKRYLPMMAPVLEWAGAPITTAFTTFFTSQEVASGYDELRLMDDAIQAKISAALSPYLSSNWQTQLQTVVQASVPQMKPQP